MCVTARHIEKAREVNAELGSASECPVRLALVEALPGHAVSRPLVGVVRIDGAPCVVPEAVGEWCLAFDAGEPVEPFAFEFDPSERPPHAPGIYDCKRFDESDSVVVLADPDEPGKPLCEFVRHDLPGRVRGFLNAFDSRGMGVLYRVELADGGAGAAFELVKLRAGSGDREARSYRVSCTYGGHEGACECRGLLRYGRPCKHIRSVSRLVAEGVLA